MKVSLKNFEKAVERVKKIKTGHPLYTETMVGAQASQEQQDKILGYIDKGKSEGAKMLTGGEVRYDVDGGYYIEPTVFKGENSMEIFRDEILALCWQ